MVMCNTIPITSVQPLQFISPSTATQGVITARTFPGSPCSIFSSPSSTCSSIPTSPGIIVPPSPLSPEPFLISCPIAPMSPLSANSPLLFNFNSLYYKPETWSQSYGMEQVWQLEFRRLFSRFYPLWCLQPVKEKPFGHCVSYTDSAKVRFCCDNCGHGWTSMKGRVAFWFDLGILTFKLYGQRCDKCKCDGYEEPMWYAEEVQKVLTNVFCKVGQVFYGFQGPILSRTRRAGKPRTPHNSELCQACKDGLCADRK